MSFLKKWGIRVVVLIGVLLVLFAGYIYVSLRRALPQTEGTLALAGLTEPVEIVRDEWGTVHIYAENEHDLFFAQGFATAQDRMWQMEMYRRYPSGRLSEVVGKSALGLDQYFRKYRMLHTAELIWEQMDEEHREIVQAYADGVNAYLEENKNALPIEYKMIQLDPAPWTPIDSLVWGNAISLQLSSNRRIELLRAQLVDAVGEEGMNFLIPYTAEETPITVPDGADNYAGFAQMDAQLFTQVDNILGTPLEGVGSNSWVVDGSMTESGMPILANDIHIGLTMPSIWHAVGLHGGRFDTVGFTLAGVPGMITGHNADIAWGMTSLSPDSQDFYIERLDDKENPTQYLYDDEWLDIEHVQEVIEVRGQDPVTLDIYITQHGPITNYPFEDPENDLPLALRWVQHEGDSTLFPAILDVNTASNWEEFRAALSQWDSPGQNFFYADREGNIGYQATGKVPLRPNGNGRLPVPGWTSDNEWQGYIPFEELPYTYNPDGGILVSANHRVEPEGYPYYISDSYTPGYRAQQIEDLLHEYEPITVADMDLIQEDTYSPQAALFSPYLDVIETNTPLEEEALAALHNWDLHTDLDGAGTAIYDMWHLRMLTNVITDELGEETAQLYIRGQYIRHATQHIPMLRDLMTDPNQAWFDNINTPEVEDRDAIIQQSFEEAVAWLAEKYGDDINNWDWGDVHTATFPHQPFNDVPVLKKIFNSNTYPTRGGNFSVYANSYAWFNPFYVWIVSSARHVTDLNDFSDSMMLGSTGQNMNLLSPHREDVTRLWHEGTMFPMSFSEEDVATVHESTLILEPEQ